MLSEIQQQKEMSMVDSDDFHQETPHFLFFF